MTLKLTPLTWFVILTVIAIGLALGLPPDPHAVHHLHTSPTAYRLAVAALLVPYAIIWFFSFYAFGKLQEYSRTLKGSKDGAAFQKITIGIGAIAFSLVVPTILSLIVTQIAAHYPGFRAASIIINNYLNLFPGLLAFLLLYNGTRALLRTSKNGIEKLDLRWHIPWFVLFSVTFSHLAIQNQYNGNPYHLPVWLLVATIIAPYIYGWTLGLLSVYDLCLYAKTAPGTLYRRAIRQFSKGIGTVIVASVAIQFINVTIGKRIGKSLGVLLLSDYALLIVIAIGLGLVAVGTKKLKRIEEV